MTTRRASYRANKYHNTRVGQFDSQAEARRFLELSARQQAGEISGLRIHPHYELQPAFRHDGKQIRAIEYEGDFEYVENGQKIVEDVKGYRTAEYKLKRKLFLFQYQNAVTFREVSA